MSPALAVVCGAALAVAGAEYMGAHLLKRASILRLASFASRNRVLSLTYDDGPGRELTPEIHAALAAAGAKATFFPTGASAQRMPSLLDAARTAGHEIGCHSMAHRHAWRCPPVVPALDMSRGFRDLERWINGEGLFRPPHGKTTLSTWFVAAAAGRPLAWWTIDSGDTRTPLPDPALVVGRIRAAGGGVVLMHDFDRSGPDRDLRHDFVLRVTTQALNCASAEGLTVVPLGELLRRMRAEH